MHGLREQIAEGVASVVYRVRENKDDDASRLLAIKVSSTRHRSCPEPHDILKEAAILAAIRHPTIVTFVNSKQSLSPGSFELWTEWVPYSLEDLLDQPAFSPSEYPTEMSHLVRRDSANDDDDNGNPTPHPRRAELFEVISKSIIYQLALALSFLHTRTPSPIAHRDVKPRNVLLTHSGCVKLIDFGIAYSPEYCDSASKSSAVMWPEQPDAMYCDVGTGAYRAPELIFGPSTYDACKMDVWSFGATIAQFFTPIRLRRRQRAYDEEGDDDEEEEGSLSYSGPPPAFILPKDIDYLTTPSAEWRRVPLFDASRGSIGLAWSIFKLRGTPDSENWPDFESLPDATKVQFMQTPCLELKAYLPNLPSNVESTGSVHAIPSDEPMRSSPLDLIHRVLVYPPSDRLAMRNVLAHTWFTEPGSGAPLLLPSEITNTDYPNDVQGVAATIWRDNTLGLWIGKHYASGEGGGS